MRQTNLHEMPSCSIITCKNKSNKVKYSKDGISFHTFPKDPVIKEKWIEATGRDSRWFPYKRSTICSSHFKKEMFQPLNKSRRLFEWAVPKINVCHVISDLEDVTELSASCSVEVKKSQVVELKRKPSTILDGSRDEENIKKPKIQDSREKKSDAQAIESDLSETPRKRKMRTIIVQYKHMIDKQTSKIRNLQKKNSRYNKKITSLKNILKDLNENNFVNSDQVSHLENFGVNDLIDRFNDKVSSKHNIKKKYSPSLKSFACTLHFYSPKAYEYVRRKFQTCLPHVRTIRKWYESVDAEPGFTQESLKALKYKAANTNHKLLCNLVVDEMAIRQGTEWDGKKMHGYVDICNKGQSGDYLAEAREALVFLITAINGSFKIPVGYFLVAGVTGEQRSTLVKQCLELIAETGIEVTSLTFDGCPANITMAKELGCCFDCDNLKTNFIDPVTGKSIFIFPDPCHMLKLLRNALEAYGVFVDQTNRHVKWCHLKHLSDIQEKEKLHLANKLRRGHIFFKNQKMKVRLASQLFSNSVADALSFCSDRNYTGFEDVDGTVNFLKTVNDLFDVMNSRNMMQLGYKKPLFMGNKQMIFEFLDKTENYIKSLKLLDGTPVINSTRKTGFIGFLACIKSLRDMYNQLVELDQKLCYIPVYKISQDHLELTFGQIRAHGGCNTNPTARQFQAIYKKLLVKVELRDFESGNCVALEEISFLSCSALQNINLSIEPREMYDDSSSDIESLYEQALFDEEINMLVEDITEFGSQAISYIAGFVVHKLIKSLKCETCISAIIANKIDDDAHAFIIKKDKGGLLYPSPDVINICKKMEVLIKTTLLKDNKITSDSKNIKERLMAKALTHFVGMDIFGQLTFHQFEQSPMNNHLTLLIKAIMEKYLNIRLYYLTKNANPRISKRQVLMKYLHFAGQ